MKRLQRYYFLVGFSLFLLLLGCVIFFDSIAGTVRGNPHPQINYVIFMLFAVGGALMLMHVHRICREGQFVESFLTFFNQGGKDSDDLNGWLQDSVRSGSYDALELLQEVVAVHGRAVGVVEHSAIEAEIDRFHAQQQRRLLVAQYLPGLMVGMGLFGTFIGLLGALQEIGKLIGGFAVGPGMADPVAAVSDLVTRLTEPMKAMGVAFSASLFGVLGSMVMGILMVFVKGSLAELLALARSRVAQMVELSKASGDIGSSLQDIQPLQSAIGQLAEHSPILKGLALALDSSERRVRDLIMITSEVIAKIDLQVKAAQPLQPLLGSMLSFQEAAAVSATQIAAALQEQSHSVKVISNEIAKQTDLLISTYAAQQRIIGDIDINRQADALRYKELQKEFFALWKDGIDRVRSDFREQLNASTVYVQDYVINRDSRESQKQAEFMLQIQNLQSTMIDQTNATDLLARSVQLQSNDVKQARLQQEAVFQAGLGAVYRDFIQELSSERMIWSSQVESIGKAVTSNQDLFGHTLHDFNSKQSDLFDCWESLLKNQFQSSSDSVATLQEMRSILRVIQETLGADGAQRLDILMQMKSTMEESKLRMQQIVALTAGPLGN